MSNLAILAAAAANAVTAVDAPTAPGVGLEPTSAGVTIGWAALLAAMICFGIFLWHICFKPTAEKAVEEAEKKGIVGLDVGAAAGFAKALGEALSKVGPELVGLIGAFLFLMLAGQAWRVWQITGSFGDATSAAATDGSAPTNAVDANAAAVNLTAVENATDAVGDNVADAMK